MEETIRKLEALLNGERTEEVISKASDKLSELDNDRWQAATDGGPAYDWLAAKWPRGYEQELYAVRGMAHYRNKDFASARADFERTLADNPANERAIYGMAYLAAYMDKDPAKTREWMEKLPESVARDNAWMIVLRSQEYLEANGLSETENEVDEIIEKWAKPNPDVPLNVANIFHNGARFHIVVGDKLVGAGKNDISYYAPAVVLLECAIGLYGTGNKNFHHRAEANYWKSVAMEKIFGPAAAVPAACESLELWHKQLKLDPENSNFQTSYTGSRERLLELIYKMGEVISGRGPTAGNYDYDLLAHVDNVLSITCLQPLTSDYGHNGAP